MDDGYRWLENIADRMKRDKKKGAAPRTERLTVRELLGKFGFQRRSEGINSRIRNGLDSFGLRTDQDITVAWLDSAITITLDSEASGESATPRPPDPTYRVSMIPAANQPPESVKSESPLLEATTIMQMKGYSRLPVMRNERDIDGVVSWESIGARLALKRECNHVHQCMEPPVVIPATTRLFDAIASVTKHGYVLVQAKDRTITGIVTQADLTEQLGQFAGPFLFLGEIEKHLRNLIHGKFTLDELRAASKPERTVEESSDLTFGGFCRLLENPDNWKKLNLAIDRKEFTNRLKSVNRLRNDVMHFNPDGIDKEQRNTLRNVARFLDKLARSIAT